MTETKTHYKKNLDPRYISGEDLKDGLALNKGLAPEMIVQIVGFEDKGVFDKNSQSEQTKTGLHLATLDGKRLYKPMILNKTNSKTCTKEFGSPYMEDWLNKPIVLYAKPDSRFDFVARFRKYFPPVQITDTAALEKLSVCANLEGLMETWKGLTAQEKALPTVIAKKDQLKESFTAAQ